ncbi:interleukin-6 [Tiliqua scincoides]|uniref:interleukin-6 n=1 Tax=Tiliqua scincoides TaxID=71010 RepID=UPI003462760B
MHFLVECCFWAATALMSFLGTEALPILDSSGEEELSIGSSSSSARTLPDRCPHIQLAHWLQGRAAAWKKELCTEQAACEGSMEMLFQNNLQLPKITKECFEMEFDKEKCLRQLSSGLYAFQTYLKYIEASSTDNAQQTSAIWQSTQHLANTLKSMMNNPDTVTMPDPVAQKTLSAKLQEHTGWNATVIKQLVLQSFTSFMETTTRAIRFMCEGRRFRV